ncbi:MULTISPECIES: hypothetical protein [Haloferax]|uniref:DUF7343 domain-containing protein n=1 Tax=Haloferax marinum TaxID=2666143 RepID=A0A6A8G493_9EURY|nr:MULTISPECIES: hypothetical protein [Haloferax]KAB1196621.1 hypothetical protein Hfx1150_03440 [Haloferax sp. CBA1150]MRW95625.1 hypothetical protein [Haloferax marinum]
MPVRTNGQRTSRMVLAALVLALVVVTAGCTGVGGGPGDGANETTREDVTEPPQVTDEPTEEPTEEPTATDEPTEAPTETEAPGGGEGDNGDTGGDESNNQTLLLLGALAVFAVGFVAAGVLRGRNKAESKTEPAAATPTDEPRSDSERVISLLHQNNGRMFQDVLEEKLDWSPSHARRVIDGLVATGDIERRETDGGTLIVFADPNRSPDEE